MLPHGLVRTFLAATVTLADADDQEVTWTSETPSVATVDENGAVTLLKAGTATIKATAGGKSDSVTFTVAKWKVGASIRLSVMAL